MNALNNEIVLITNGSAAVLAAIVSVAGQLPGPLTVIGSLNAIIAGAYLIAYVRERRSRT